MAVPLVEISGPPRERGRGYGEAARTEIQASADYYRQAFELASGLDWAAVRVAARAWRAPIGLAAPDLLSEMDGIAEGANLHPDEVLALNARGEIVRSRDSGFGAEPADDCSSFALLPEATGDAHVYCGQNWDWRVGTEPTVVLLRIVQPPKPTIVMQVEAGQIGRQGANSAGIALNANGLDGRFGTPLGLPQPVLRRLILDCDRLRDALQVPFEVHPHLAGNLLVTSREGVAVDLETTPAGHRWGLPEDGVLVHANHYRYGVPEPIARTYRMSAADSLYRVQVLERGFRAVRDAPAAAQVRKLVASTMSDHTGFPDAVCRHPDDRVPPLRRGKTIAASLVDLTTGEYRVAPGNPCEHDYELLPWQLYDGPGGDR